MITKLKFIIARFYWRVFKPRTLGVRLLLIRDNKVLLVKHTYLQELYLPGGGVKNNECFEEAIRREIKEELNFDLEEFEFLNNHKLILPDGKSYNKIWQFIGPLKDNLQKIVQKEGRSMKLFTLDEARKLTIYETDIDILKSIEEYIAKKIVR